MVWPSGDPGTPAGEEEELLTKHRTENIKRETFPVSPSTVSKSMLPCSEPSVLSQPPVPRFYFAMGGCVRSQRKAG